MNDLEQRIEDEFTQLYSDISVRYNDENGAIQIYRNGAWEDAVAVSPDPDELYLYNGGDNAVITGGWKMTNTNATAAALSVSSTLGIYMLNHNIGQPTEHSPTVSTLNAIDVTKYTKATFFISSYQVSSGSTSCNCNVGVSDTFGSNNIKTTPYSRQENANNVTLTLDLSGVTREKYFNVGTYYASIYISKILLE